MRARLPQRCGPGDTLCRHARLPPLVKNFMLSSSFLFDRFGLPFSYLPFPVPPGAAFLLVIHPFHPPLKPFSPFPHPVGQLQQ